MVAVSLKKKTTQTRARTGSRSWASGSVDFACLRQRDRDCIWRPVPLRGEHAGAVNQLLRFFFQAEDGIRDYKVTGVQTCALPISSTTPTARTRQRVPGPRA